MMLVVTWNWQLVLPLLPLGKRPNYLRTFRPYYSVGQRSLVYLRVMFQKVVFVISAFFEEEKLS
jgi:hypothetical protein